MPTVGMWNESKYRLLAYGSWLHDMGEDEFGSDLTIFSNPCASEFKQQIIGV